MVSSYIYSMTSIHSSLCGSLAISVAPWLPHCLLHSLSGSLASSEAFPMVPLLSQWFLAHTVVDMAQDLIYHEGIGWPGLLLPRVHGPYSAACSRADWQIQSTVRQFSAYNLSEKLTRHGICLSSKLFFYKFADLRTKRRLFLYVAALFRGRIVRKCILLLMYPFIA